jgi:hypothetical protein
MPARKTRTKKAKKPRNRPPDEEAAKRDRAVKALDLRIAGATYRQIAGQSGPREQRIIKRRSCLRLRGSGPLPRN